MGSSALTRGHQHLARKSVAGTKAPIRQNPRMRLPEVLIFLASWGVARAAPGR